RSGVRRPGVPARAVTGGLKAGESFFARFRDVEQGVELRQLEQGSEVLVEVREPELPTLLADLLREADQHAEPRRIDVSGVGEVDQELPLSVLQLIQDLLLELLAVAHDE